MNKLLESACAENDPHKITIRIYYEDTDFSGLVYHASYLRFMERGRSELLRGLGLHQRELLEGSTGTPFFFVVRAMDIDFKKPALMDDLLTIETWVKGVGGASVLLEQRVLRDTDLLVQAAVTVVCVENRKAKRLPADVRSRFLSRQKGASHN